MNILIHLRSDSELISYEAVSLAFVLASFDHQVQLRLARSAHSVLVDPNSRLHGMIKSLNLYDMPVAWLDGFDELKTDNIDGDLLAMLSPTPNGLTTDNFDSELTF